MIQYLNTSIFDSPSRLLVNPVNTVGVMGKGLAAQFARKYPENLEIYKYACKTGDFKIGSLQFYYAPSGITVCNFPTKQHWRNPSKIEYIESGLKSLIEDRHIHIHGDVAIPLLGCGLGSLTWDVVGEIVESYFAGYSGVVYIHWV